MNSSDEKALEDLYALSSREDLQKTLDSMFHGFLESSASDIQEDRINVLVFYQRISNLF